MSKELTYEEFIQTVDESIQDRVSDEYIRYGDGDESYEQWYYANIKWIMSVVEIDGRDNKLIEILNES